MTYRRIFFMEYTRAGFVAQWLEQDGRFQVKRDGDDALWTDAPKAVLRSIPSGTTPIPTYRAFNRQGREIRVTIPEND